jgi:hypothetical protein
VDVFPTRAVVTASLGDFDRPLAHEPQSVKYDLHEYNAPPRKNSMTPRLQAKIPKCFAWQIYPGYDVYVWLDGNLRLKHPNSLKYLLEQLEGHDVVVLQHPDRDTIYWEYRYNLRAVTNNAPSRYMLKRYEGEHLQEQFDALDIDTKEKGLYNGGIIVYRNTPKVQEMLKDWWYHITRYLVMDQLSWAYVLKKSGLKINVLPDVFRDCWWLENARHAK